MNSRRVLVLANSLLCEELDKILNVAGWRVLHATEVAAPKLQLDQSDYAGLVEIVRGDPDEIERMEVLTADTPWMEWIALLPHRLLNNPTVQRLLKTSFFDYHTLPIDPERLLYGLGHAHGKGLLAVKSDNPQKANGKYGMIGISQATMKLYRAIEKSSAVDMAVMISGESGTGKELAARAIHQLSSRREGNFIAVNCAALSANLIQSELFGHEKGAFTGAHQSKIGRLEAASGGTIFLDEIGDLPAELQVNLLRVLQDKVIQRLGCNREIHLNVRVITASHVNLERAVEQGQFREDLYYRLNVLRLITPPLRERTGDIELLASTYVEQFVRDSHSLVRGFSRHALCAMESYSWPGNVRELINRVSRAVILGENRYLTPSDLELERRIAVRDATTLEQARTHAEHTAIRSALRQNHNNMTQAARQLGISRTTLYRLLGNTKQADSSSTA